MSNIIKFFRNLFCTISSQASAVLKLLMHGSEVDLVPFNNVIHSKSCLPSGMERNENTIITCEGKNYKVLDNSIL